MAFGIRRNKVILSARSNNANIHVGKLLSSHFPDGLAGGHKSLGGGQIPFEIINQQNSEDEEQNEEIVMENPYNLARYFFVKR